MSGHMPETSTEKIVAFNEATDYLPERATAVEVAAFIYMVVCGYKMDGLWKHIADMVQIAIDRVDRPSERVDPN